MKREKANLSGEPFHNTLYLYNDSPTVFPNFCRGGGSYNLARHVGIVPDRPSKSDCDPECRPLITSVVRHKPFNFVVAGGSGHG
jgi:hypothetical protein